ncbi:MAG: DUF3303 family protein [Phycisphaerales bacterium]|nr:DUF3303 family protein [Phycisphaerales bacterium]
MLFMVIERFKAGRSEAVGERFKRCGRMLPEGVNYLASWVEDSGASCFQLMESPGREGIDAWIACWSDLVDFEVFPVLTSADYWARAAKQTADEAARSADAAGGDRAGGLEGTMA